MSQTKCLSMSAYNLLVIWFEIQVRFNSICVIRSYLAGWKAILIQLARQFSLNIRLTNQIRNEKNGKRKRISNYFFCQFGNWSRLELNKTYLVLVSFIFIKHLRSMSITTDNRWKRINGTLPLNAILYT